MAQKILVLDDEENYAEMLESLLEQHLFVVDSATKPELALKALEQKGYDLVISDYKMPVMDGADFLQKAREINPDLPFIIVSGLMNTPELVKVANMGVTLVLEKPIDIENFIQQVKKFVQPLSEEEYSRTSNGDETSNSQVGAGGRRFIKTYPDNCEHVSDLSPLMQFFLQDMWDSLQEQNHVFIRCPKGGEAELLLAEVNRWKSGTATPSLILNAAGPVGLAAQQFRAYQASPSPSPIVGILGFEGASLESQESLVDVIREAPESYTFLYFVDQHLLEKKNSGINEELMELIQESLCHLPELSLRPSDLAVYLNRYMKQLSAAESLPKPAGIEPKAAACILQYPWPGNFAELVQFLRVAIARSHGESLSESLVTELLGESAKVAGPLLETRLKQAQLELINKALADTGSTLAGLLEVAGIDPLELNSMSSPEALPLLFPELLKSTD